MRIAATFLLGATTALLAAVPAGAGAPKPSVTRIGVMAAGAKTKKVRLGVPRKLEVLYVRPNIAVRIGAPGQNLTALDDTQRAGFRLVLNVNNAPKSGTPASAPSDMAAYSAEVAKALERYRPDVTVIEN